MTICACLPRNEVIASIPDGNSAPYPFEGFTLPPVPYPAGRKDMIITLCRQKFARPRSIVEPRINKLFRDSAAEKDSAVVVGETVRKLRRHTPV